MLPSLSKAPPRSGREQYWIAEISKRRILECSLLYRVFCCAVDWSVTRLPSFFYDGKQVVQASRLLLCCTSATSRIGSREIFIFRGEPPKPARGVDYQGLDTRTGPTHRIRHWAAPKLGAESDCRVFFGGRGYPIRSPVSRFAANGNNPSAWGTSWPSSPPFRRVVQIIRRPLTQNLDGRGRDSASFAETLA